jgi:lysosomal acid lipase/cholesteryl ester hydrolase
MKKRIIFCLFLSIYLIYANGSKFCKDFFIFDKFSKLFEDKFGFDLKRTFGSYPDYKNSMCSDNSNIVENETVYPSKCLNESFSQNKYNQNSSLPIYQKKVLEIGCEFEQHKILTEDGYILTAWRIFKTKTKNNSTKAKPIILQHGLFDSSYTWLMLQANQSLPIILAEKGYDVWLTNSRGNIFSLEHTNEDYDSSYFYSKFWDFSFHEMAQYDLPANIFYIKNITGSQKVDYIGHSQGTVQYFIKYSLNPTFIHENVQNFVSIGTVVNIFNTTSKIVHILESTYIMKMMEQLYLKNLFIMHPILHDFVAYSCKYLNTICEYIVRFFIEDFPTNKIDYSQLFENFFHIPGGTSTRNVNHWVQFYETKLFKQFDYGKEINYLKYGQSSPPSYDLTKFKHYQVRSLMTISNADPFSKPEDCQHLFEFLNEEVFTILKLENFNHLDYLWSRDSLLLYQKIIDFLEFNEYRQNRKNDPLQFTTKRSFFNE